MVDFGLSLLSLHVWSDLASDDNSYPVNQVSDVHLDVRFLGNARMATDIIEDDKKNVRKKRKCREKRREIWNAFHHHGSEISMNSFNHFQADIQKLFKRKIGFG